MLNTLKELIKYTELAELSNIEQLQETLLILLETLVEERCMHNGTDKGHDLDLIIKVLERCIKLARN